MSNMIDRIQDALFDIIGYFVAVIEHLFSVKTEQPWEPEDQHQGPWGKE